MASLHLFPCPLCGQTIEIQSVQAGQEIHCSHCDGRSVAPKMGEIKKLPRAGENEATRPPTQSSGSQIKRTLFACGLALSIIALASGTALYYYARSHVVDVNWDDEFTLMDEQIDKLSPAEVFHQWYQLRPQDGLGPWLEQPLAQSRTYGTILTNIAYGLWGLAIPGLGLLFGSFLVKGRST